MGIVKLNILDVLQEKNMSLEEFAALPGICLLYTSDAADEL